MSARLIRIDKSQAVRLSKVRLEQAGIGPDLEIEAKPGMLPITAAGSPRAGWAEAAQTGGAQPLLDAPTSTKFDNAEWEW